MTIIQVIETLPTGDNWANRLTADDWYHWSRHRELLNRKPGWNPEQIDSVAAQSLKILRRLPDPIREGAFQARGLVVGYVQSGKTANYTALAARAADAGFRLVVVLSGIHESLRSQTQNRLERELTGHQTGGVGPAEVGHEWIRLTDPDDDFRPQDVRILQSTAPFLIVAKKHVKVLERIDRWLDEAARFLCDIPLLLIDDEADQASINTQGGQDPAIREDSEGGDGDEEVEPSQTNGWIRSILKRAEKAAYVAYTATPFANILISPGEEHSRLGPDLFPRDFVVQLPRPRGYTGTEELFGVASQRRQVRKSVTEDDVRLLKPPSVKRKASAPVRLDPGDQALPKSLTDAVLAFCVAGGIREMRCRGADEPLAAHTMLVHISMLKADQARVANLLSEQIDLWRAAVDQGQSLRPVMLGAWNELRPGVEPPGTDDQIVSAATSVLTKLHISVLNSDTGEELDYEDNPGRHVIAIGGNRLSRGLTLEGLTISYFLRTATMCDTLLQMARWYGFRHGYEDLIRIWTTDGIARWFGELALVEQSMRDSIHALELAGRRPDEMHLRVRAHSDLLLTARNKSRMATGEWDSWSGDHPQTILLPLDDPPRLIRNLELTDSFLSGLRTGTKRHGGSLFRDVTPEEIQRYLGGYHTHDDAVAFRPGSLATWIASRQSAGELTSWSVFVPNPGDRETVKLGGVQYGLIERRRVSAQSIGTLLDPRHEGVDLPAGPSAYRREGGTLDAEAMRRARPVTDGLLIIYPLDPGYLGVADDVPLVVGLGLSLPFTTDLSSRWVVNAGVADA